MKHNVGLTSRHFLKIAAWKDKDGDWYETGLHIFCKLSSFKNIFFLAKSTDHHTIYANIWLARLGDSLINLGRRFYECVA